MSVRFRIRGEFRVAEGAPGSTLADLAFAAGIPLNTACGARGSCGRCAVVLHEGSFFVRDRKITVAPGAPHRALACATRTVSADALVEIPDRSLIEQRARIADDFTLRPFEWTPVQRRATVTIPGGGWQTASSDVERLAAALGAAGGPVAFSMDLDAARTLPTAQAGPACVDVSWGPYRGGTDVTVAAPAGTTRHLGLAVDLGTTTVVVLLADLETGHVLGRAPAYNAQMRKGDDVAARISVGSTADGLRALHSLVVRETVNPLVEEVCAKAACAPGDIVRVTAAGNSVMAHLFLGLSPAGIGALPFQPVRRRHPECRARDLGLLANGNAIVDVLPSMTGHVGGDLVADACAARLLDRDGLVMLVDIGTNGEILLWDGRRLLCTATAAGPAFEGAGLRHGMRAADGAVDHIRWTDGPNVEWTTIGNAPAAGFCGSAVIDFVAQSFKAGLLDAVGRFDMDRLRAAGVDARVEHCGRSIHACRVVPGEVTSTGHALTVSEADVAEILKAKAAIHAGIVTLLATAGRRIEDLDTLVLAGGFARHIHLRHAAWMGLLPDLPPGRIEVIGNGSLAGAFLALGDPAAAPEFERIVRAAEPVELNLCPGFESAYIDSMLLPNADPSAFAMAVSEMGRPSEPLDS
ncbi:MAG: DUF4445 domain-containing protein [Verrucomicrobia bacterium]|nr:DUF4445 domain-containing protein [Verrucomicrobiota bacterium]